MPVSLPEIREGEASPEIASLYGEIRREMRVPLVNLIYRHLATLPGALPWSWGLLRQAVASGALDRAQERIAHLGATFSAAPTDNAALAPPDLGPSDRGAIAALLDAYNRSNIQNLIGLTAVRKLLHGRPPDMAAAILAELPPRRAASGPVPSALPLPRLSELPETTASLVRALASRHESADRGVTPSLYLHLAHWPRFLEAAQDRLEPLFADRTLERCRDKVGRLAEIEAETLLPYMGREEPPGGSVLSLERALETFTRGVIPDMIPVGFTLTRWMGAADAGT